MNAREDADKDRENFTETTETNKPYSLVVMDETGSQSEVRRAQKMRSWRGFLPETIV